MAERGHFRLSPAALREAAEVLELREVKKFIDLWWPDV
jgi:hypothetical protein